ncbi:MAG: DEAD/DEAH box helicase, partial [Deltaproteobacteria bacterium]
MLAPFSPLVARWFHERFGRPTPVQEAGWPAIARGEDTLLAAPTGSGKTLAAFLWSIDRLVREPALEQRTHVVYVSPLKALGNDVQRNLARPLAELADLAAASGEPLPDIRVFVRSGDTPPAERQAMLRRPPHILITTPESLYILLTAEGSRRFLAGAGTVIVDEIHAVAADKRGAHLALSLERLDALAGRPPRRHGRAAPHYHRRRSPARARPVDRDSGPGARADRHPRALGRHLRPHRHPRAQPPDDDRLREHPPAGRARRPPARGTPRDGARGGPPRQHGAPHPARGRGTSQVGRGPRGGRDGVARARDRRRLGRPRLSRRRAARARHPHSTRRPLGARPRRRTDGDRLPAHAGRPRAGGGGGASGASGRARPPPRPHEPARHPCPADGRPGGDGRDPDRGSLGVRPAGVSLPDARAGGFRRRPRHAGRRRGHPARPARRAPAPRPRAGTRACAAGRPPRRDHERRGDPRHGGLRRRRGAAGPEGGHGQRGLRGREHGRRHLPPRQSLVAHPAGRGRAGARGGRGRRAAHRALLARRGAGPHARALDRGLGAPDGGRRAVAGGRGRLARPRVRPCPRRGRPAGRVRRRDPGGARHGPDAGVCRRRALLRRGRRHAARGACAVRRPDQPRVGAGAAEELLRHLQLRAAGRRHRRRPGHLARRAAQLPAGRRVRHGAASESRRGPDPGRARLAPLHQSVALECDALAGTPPARGRAPRADALPAHAGRRPPGRGLPGAGRVRGQRRRADPHPRSSARPRDDRQLPPRGHGPGRAPGGAGRDRARRDRDPGDRDRGPLADVPRDPELEPLHLPRRRAARGASGTRRLPPPHRRRPRQRSRGARSGGDRGSPCAGVARRPRPRRAARHAPLGGAPPRARARRRRMERARDGSPRDRARRLDRNGWRPRARRDGAGRPPGDGRGGAPHHRWRLARVRRADDRRGARRAPRPRIEPGRDRARRSRGDGRRPPRPFHSGDDGRGMVRPPAARPHSPPDARASPSRHRAGRRRGLRALPLPLAACPARHPAPRPRRSRGGAGPAPGSRAARACLGGADPPRPRRALRPGRPGAALPLGRGRLGTAPPRPSRVGGRDPRYPDPPGARAGADSAARLRAARGSPVAPRPRARRGAPGPPVGRAFRVRAPRAPWRLVPRR